MSIFQSGTDPALLLMSTPIHDRKALSGTGDGGPCDSRDRPAPDSPQNPDAPASFLDSAKACPALCAEPRSAPP